MNLHEYFGLCADHDWDYYSSIDSFRYKTGIQEADILMEYYHKIDNGYRDIYNEWMKYHQKKRNKPEFREF